MSSLCLVLRLGQAQAGKCLDARPIAGLIFRTGIERSLASKKQMGIDWQELACEIAEV